MELFWTIFWILLLIVPALWLVSIIWSVAMYTFIFIVVGIAEAIGWLYRKIKGE